MQVKRLIIVLLLAGIFLSVSAAAEPELQQEQEIPVAIRYFIKGLNEHSYITAKPYISSEFGIEGVPPEYLRQALNQVFTSFPVSIEHYAYESHGQERDGTLYTLKLMAQGRVSSVDFLLDYENKVLGCSLFRAQQPGEVMSIDNRKLVSYAEQKFELVNGIIILPVKLNGTEVDFILDSGAPMLVLNAAADSTRRNAIIAGARGIGGDIRNMGFSHVESLQWAGGSNSNFDALSMDLSHLEQELGRKFHGLIGMAELEPYEVYLDYATQTLRLYQLKDNGTLASREKLPRNQTQIKFDLNRHIAVLKAGVGKKKLQLGLDTGAQTNLLDDEFYSVYADVISEEQSDTLRGADLNEAAISTAVIPLTKIGKNEFPAMRYAFSDISAMNTGYNLNLDGLLGYPFLSRQPVSINYRKQVIRLY
jgi:hypothetical protein